MQEREIKLGRVVSQTAEAGAGCGAVLECEVAVTGSFYWAVDSESVLRSLAGRQVWCGVVWGRTRISVNWTRHL